MTLTGWNEDLIASLLGTDLPILRLLNRRVRDLWDGVFVYPVIVAHYDKRLLQLSRAYSWTASCLSRGVIPRNSLDLEPPALQNVLRKFITPETLGQDVAILVPILQDSWAIAQELLEIESNLHETELVARTLRYVVRQTYRNITGLRGLDRFHHRRMLIWYRFHSAGVAGVIKMYGTLDDGTALAGMVELDMLMMILYRKNRDTGSPQGILDLPTDPRYPWLYELRYAYYLLGPDITIPRNIPYLTKLFLAYLECATFSLPDTVSEYYANPMFRDSHPDTHRLVMSLISQDAFATHRTLLLHRTLLQHTGIIS